MKIKNKTKTILSSALAILCVSSSLNAQSVDFNLSRDTDEREYYRNFHAGDAGTFDIGVVGFEADITHINSVPVSFDSAFAAFCIEIDESINIGSNTYEVEELEGITSAYAGQLGQAASAVPLGGIGDLAAARIRALFDNHYQSSDLSDWDYSVASPLPHAFQLAVWEISHDDDLSLSDTTGSIYIGRQGSGNDLQKNAIKLAQSWLDEIASVNTAYQSQTWDVNALESLGHPGYQDLVYATPIPEPSSALLLSLGGLATLVYRRR